MAKRYNLTQTEACRDKIQVSQLINRLQDHVFTGSEMSATQLRAAEILLDRKLPRMASQEVTVNTQTPFAYIPDIIQDDSAWQSRHKPTTKTEH